jgi:hypothetical protein
MMIGLLLVVWVLALFSFGAAADTNTSSLDALVKRQLPFHADKFKFFLAPQVTVNMKTHSDLDTFTVFDAPNATIGIECSTRSACARGLYTYLAPL